MANPEKTSSRSPSAESEESEESEAVSSERWAATDQPSRARDHAQLLAEHASVIIAELDPETSRLVYVTGAVKEQLGYSPAELLELDSPLLIHEEDREATCASVVQALNGERHSSVPHRVRHKDGSWRWIELTLREFQNESAERRIVLVSRDVTQRCMVEEALEEQLSCQTRIAELSHYFLALPAQEIAHGIQTQLPIAAELADADSVSLVWLAPTSGIEACSTWAVPGSGALPLRTDDQTRTDFAWCVKQLMKEQTIHIHDVDALPEEAAAEQADLRRRKVRSSLTIPLRSTGGLGGFFTFERVSRAEAWPDAKIEQLRVMVEIFAAAADRQRREFALQESEERFRAMTDHATELVSEIDHQGIYRYVSPSYRDLLGHEPADLIGETSSVLVHPDDLPEVEATFRSAFECRGKATAISRLRDVHGTWHWVEISGRVFRTAKGDIRLVSIGRDITKRIEMEQAIRQQRDLEEGLAKLSRHFLQLSTSEIEDAVRAALEEVAGLAGADYARLVYLGQTRATKIPAYSWPASKADDDPAGAGQWSKRPWSAGKFLRNEPTQIVRIADMPAEAAAEREYLRERGVRSRLSLPIYSGSTPMGCLSFECTQQERAWSDSDITLLRMIGELLTGALRRRQTEVALDESRGQLLHAQKMEAVGRLAGGIAHDFNNLLTIILGFCRPLLGELEPADPIREDISAIQDSAERAASLTRQLLTFSRRQNVEMQPLQLNELLRTLLPMLRRLVGEDVDVGLELASELDSIQGDPHQFEQLVMNVAANARDAMPDGGSLVLRTRNERIFESEASQLGLARGGHFVLLQIQDTGIGMDELTRNRIFDPFFTTKEADRGTGLGLSLVYGIVEQMGGAVTAEAEPGKGTSFQILVPVSRGDR